MDMPTEMKMSAPRPVPMKAHSRLSSWACLDEMEAIHWERPSPVKPVTMRDSARLSSWGDFDIMDMLDDKEDESASKISKPLSPTKKATKKRAVSPLMKKSDRLQLNRVDSAGRRRNECLMTAKLQQWRNKVA